MRNVQIYLSVFGSLRLRTLIAILLSAYFGVVVLFAGVYCIFDLVEPNAKGIVHPRFLDHIYFSFVTQSTVGYGDYRPVGAGKAVVVVQTLVALLVFAVGTAAVVTRLTTPQQDGLTWDPILVFDPTVMRFRARFVNRFPVDLAMATITFRYRYRRITQRGEAKWSRKTVQALRDTISEIPRLYPLLASTMTIESFNADLHLTPGVDMVLKPVHITEGASVSAFLLAYLPSGSAVFSHRWTKDQIVCGHFNSTYDDAAESGVDWSKWGTYTQADHAECDCCVASKDCPLST